MPTHEPRWTDEQVAMALYAHSVVCLLEKIPSETLEAVLRNPVRHWNFKLSPEERDSYRDRAAAVRAFLVDAEAPCAGI